MRPEFGARHPALLDLLARERPAVVEYDSWGDGAIPLRIAAYDRPARLPDELITSVRCLVQVGDLVVVCQNADGVHHPWPGGRREPGETFAETASREVREETGWLIDVATLRPLGWLHLQHLRERPAGHPLSHFPHPDFLQLVFSVHASKRLAESGQDWTDPDGYELSSQLASISEAIRLVSSGDRWAIPFLEILQLGGAAQ
jgi:ADP-ribose pyrophosphatase YjhB (NUDIX family)